MVDTSEEATAKSPIIRTPPVKAVLCDIDGTLVFKGEAVPGAAEALRRLRDAGIAVRFLTNITGRLPGAIADTLMRAGIDVAPEEIETAATACASLLGRQSGRTAWLLLPEAVLPAFAGIPRDDQRPDFVVIGDVGPGFTYAAMNRAFLMLDAGADLVALQRNMFWFDGPQKRLDAGAFVAGLEAASGRTAIVTGKPSPDFFHEALRHLGCTPGETVVVGDDVLTDIRGAHDAGMRSVLVETGKFHPGQLAGDRPRPTWRVPSVAALPRLLDRVRAG